MTSSRLCSFLALLIITLVYAKYSNAHEVDALLTFATRANAKAINTVRKELIGIPNDQADKKRHGVDGRRMMVTRNKLLKSNTSLKQKKMDRADFTADYRNPKTHLPKNN